MPAVYVKHNLNLPKNTGVYQTKNMGVRVYGTNRNYVHKKPRNGVIIGTDLLGRLCGYSKVVWNGVWGEVYLKKRTFHNGTIYPATI